MTGHTDPAPRRSLTGEGLVLVVITVVIGAMAGAASFTHMHDWTMSNSPAGTPQWFGWANAVVSELTPTASVLVLRRRRLHGQHIGFPVFVLLASVALSLSAQFAQATPSVSGWLLAAVPALGFLAMTKLALGHTTSHPTGLADHTELAATVDPIPADNPDPAEPEHTEPSADDRPVFAPWVAELALPERTNGTRDTVPDA